MKPDNEMSDFEFQQTYVGAQPPTATSTLSPSALAEGRRLMEAATPAPWRQSWSGYSVKSMSDGPEFIVAAAPSAERATPSQLEAFSRNADLIQWMRNHLPALLSAAERLSQVEGEKAACGCPRSMMVDHRPWCRLKTLMDSGDAR